MAPSGGGLVTEDRRQRAEDGGQRAEGRGQRAEGGGRRTTEGEINLSTLGHPPFLKGDRGGD